MGGYFSALPHTQQQICYDSSSLKNSEPSFNKTQNQVQTERSLNQLSDESREKLDEFRLDLARKHERRREILAEKRKEMEDLRQQVILLKQENEILKRNKPDGSLETIEIQRLRRENEELKVQVEENGQFAGKIENLSVKNNQLRVQIAEMQNELQGLNSEAMNFEREKEDYQTHVTALKDVIKVSKHMLQIREAQLKELKDKVESIEETLASREMNILSQDLREEYERQLQNIRNLRQLYEERYRANKLEKEQLASNLEETKKELEDEQKKNLEHTERITQLENENSEKYDEIKSLQSDYGLSKAECREYQAELAVINQLFSQILLGFNNTQAQGIDLDKLKNLLEENHGLLQNIVVNELSKEVSSTLPKVLLDLVNQVKEKDTENDQTQIETESQASSSHQLNSVEEIVENLPKVWRVLIELLSHQKAPINMNLDEEKSENPCYKRVETTKGSDLVISVSQTYIHLKNLILEKKSLEKETNNLKQLNGHLESRLQDQEKRLQTVTSELSKTWHVVGKLQKQHHLLHTQEKILRYELAQKRKLLGQLREELEYSREKWLQAREKNTTTEREWKQLRKEFASRRNNNVVDDINNSCESGYSDDRECSSSDDEPGYETDISECNQKPAEELEVMEENLAENEEEAHTSNSTEGTSNHKPLGESISNAPCKQSAEELEISEENLAKKVNENDEEANFSNATEGTSNQFNHKPLEGSKSNAAEESSSSSPIQVEDLHLLEENMVEKVNENSEETCFSNVSDEMSKPVEAIEVLGENIVTHVDTIVEEAHCSNVTEEISNKNVDFPVKTEEVQTISQEKTESTNTQEPSTSFQQESQEMPKNTKEAKEDKPRRTLEEVLAARDARLKRLESEAQQLVTKVTNTNIRSVDISKQLDDLHEVYGESSSNTGDLNATEETQTKSEDNDNVNQE